MRIFAPAYERKVSSKQEKHCDTVLSLKSAKFLLGGLALMLSLVVYAICSRLGISTGVRYVLKTPFLKGVCRYPMITDMST